MLRRALAALTASVAATSAALAAGAVAPAVAVAGDRPEVGAYVALLTPGHDARREAPALAARHGVALCHVYGTVSGFAFRGTAEKAEAIARNPNVQVVDADHRVRIATESTPAGVARVHQPEATLAGATGAGAVVAVLDTGIDVHHPDLQTAFVPTAAGTDGSAYAGATPSSEGFVGKDCVASDGRDSSFDDDQYHGTHVAGTIAAPANGIGVVGVAPEAKVVPVKVLDRDGDGTWSDIICGIDFVAANASKITVANMSLGGSGTAGTSCSSSGLRSAICTAVDAGVPFVVAAGNSTADAAGFVPAAYPEVIAVSAVDVTNNAFASFSNYGGVVDVTAPGVAVYSTVPVEQAAAGYGNLNGTSMASPHAAGVAALALIDNAALKPTATDRASPLRRFLRTSGTCNGTGSIVGESCSTAWGLSRDADNEPMVDAHRAVTQPVVDVKTGTIALTARSTVVNSKFWTATATVQAAADGPAGGVTVVGNWTTSAGRTIATGRSCVTSATGTCSLTTPSLDRKTIADAVFTVTSATKAGFAFPTGGTVIARRP